MEELPHIDEHAIATDAPREAVWTSLLRTVRQTMGGSAAFGRVLGCEPARTSKLFGGIVGQTVTGFRVVDAVPGHRLTLEGRHRFARYRLTFHIDDAEVRARTDAAFPGALGRLYRAAVIGTGGHRLMVRRILRQVSATH